MNFANPTITILGTATSRIIELKDNKGTRTVHYQPARFESSDTRFRMEYEIGAPDQAVPVGTVFDWNVGEDIVQGRFGPELGRNRTLIKREAEVAQLTRAK
ncbi:MAG TPA: hypothetical protein VIG88_12940 [Lysobacter sp.]